MVVVFRLGPGSCLVSFPCANQFISAIDYNMHHEVYGSILVHCIHSIMTHHICSIFETPGMYGISM